MSGDFSDVVLSKRIDSVSPSATLAVDIAAKRMRAEGIDVISFGAGEPDFPTPDNIVEAALSAVKEPTNYRYSPTAGLPQLRAAIAEKTAQTCGIQFESSQVVVTNGGKQAVYETFQVLLDPGDEVIVMAPYWTSYPEVVKLAGGTPVIVMAGAQTGFIPRIDDLERARTDKTKAVILNSPTNPTGAVWNAQQLLELGQWALAHGIWVIADEIYEHLTYGRVQTSYIAQVFPPIVDQLVILNGVAKTYAMTGWRVGWLVAPQFFAAAAEKLQGHLTSNVSNISQRAALEALTGPQRAVEQMRVAFEHRRRLIVEALNAVDGVECVEPFGAFYAFADIHDLLEKSPCLGSSADLAAALLKQAHVAAIPGEAFGAPGFLRFSYALAADDLVEGMRRFKEYAEGIGNA